MARDITLSGGEIALLKALGLSGASVSGKTLIGRLGDLEDAEIIDTLTGLIALDFVECDVNSLRTVEDLEDASLKANLTHLKDLRDAMSPQRRERAGRRQRRG